MNESTLPESVSEDSIEALRVETALSRFPIHSLTTGEVKIDYKNLGRATEWRVSHNATYGAPGALAYKLDTLVVNKRIEQGGRPVPQVLRLGSLNDIAKEMGTNVSGKSLANIKNALLQNAFTGITAKMSYKTRDGEEREIEIADTRYGVVFTGDKLPSGQKADGVYLLLHDFYREILNFAQSRPLDYTYMKSLTPMAQRFYEIVSYAIYAALLHKNKSCKMRYSEFCKLSTATRYYEYDQVKKQMHKIHKPHVESGYLDRVIKFQLTEDENNHPDWWMYYTPGINAGREYEEFTQLPKREKVKEFAYPPQQMLLSFIEQVPAIPAEPTPAPKKEEDRNQVIQDLMAELVRLGVGKGVALTLASQHEEECRLQISYLPYAEVKSSVGAYLASAIKQGFAPPARFQEIQTKKAEDERKRKVAEARVAQERAQTLRAEMEAAEIDSLMATLEAEDPADYQAFEAFVEAEKERTYPRSNPLFQKPDRRERLLAPFDAPPKRRELFKVWQTQKDA
jgi:hypothetical protein